MAKLAEGTNKQNILAVVWKQFEAITEMKSGCKYHACTPECQAIAPPPKKNFDICAAYFYRLDVLLVPCHTNIIKVTMLK